MYKLEENATQSTPLPITTRIRNWAKQILSLIQHVSPHVFLWDGQEDQM